MLQRLKLIFTCCHPALALEAQVGLTLRTVGGLTTPEIARAFLVAVPTMNQRVTRAKQKIRLAAIPFQIPPPERVAERLEAVRTVLYLIFNEGFTGTQGNDLLRPDLCTEAIRLARILDELLAREAGPPDDPETLGLLALMLLQDSHRAARVDARGELVVLEKQDRSLWDADYYSFHAARADLLRRAGYSAEAQAAYVRALALCQNQAERRYLSRQIAELASAA